MENRRVCRDKTHLAGKDKKGGSYVKKKGQSWRGVGEYGPLPPREK